MSLASFYRLNCLPERRYASAGTSCGPVSVCLSVTSRSSVETDERIEPVLARALPSPCPTSSCRKIRVSPLAIADTCFRLLVMIRRLCTLHAQIKQTIDMRCSLMSSMLFIRRTTAERRRQHWHSHTHASDSLVSVLNRLHGRLYVLTTLHAE